MAGTSSSTPATSMRSSRRICSDKRLRNLQNSTPRSLCPFSGPLTFTVQCIALRVIQRQLLPRLRDPEFTKVFLVTLPEATPVHEAQALLADLRRAGIEPAGWIVNQSFAGDGLRDPILLERGVREFPFIAEVRDKLAGRLALIPWTAQAPVGPERLLVLAQSRLVATQSI